MLGALDVVVFLKSQGDLDGTAEHVFGVLKTSYEPAEAEEWGGRYCRATGLGFSAALFANTGSMLDPEYEHYQYGLEISSDFWCVELDAVDLEGPLSEYYARQLAFALNIETATEVLLDTTEEAEIFEIRAFRRNPQYRLDQAPTVPKVYLVESRQVAEPFDEEDEGWEEADEGDEVGAEQEEER